jgi:hypothetical protein
MLINKKLDSMISRKKQWSSSNTGHHGGTPNSDAKEFLLDQREFSNND